MVNRIDGNHYYEYRKSQNVNLNDKTETGEKFSLDYKKDDLSSEDREKKDNGKEAVDAAKTVEQGGVRLELSNRGKSSSMDGTKAFGTADARGNTEQVSLADMLRNFIRSAVSVIKNLLYRIWYDSPADGQDDAAKTETDISEISVPNESTDQTLSDSAYISEENAGMQTDSLQEDAGMQTKDSIFMTLQSTEKEPTSEELTNAMRNETARIDREVQQYLKSGNLSQVVSLLTNEGKKTAAHNSTLLTYYDRNGRMIELNASDKERILHGDRGTRKL